MKTRKAIRIAPLAMSLAIVGGFGTAQSAQAETAAATGNLFDSSCTHVMKSGEKNGCVTRLQELLNSKNSAGLTADGVYGETTVKAVTSWQAKKGLEKDGKAGPQTKRTLEGDHRAIAYWAKRLDSQTSPGDPGYDFGAGHGASPGPEGGGIDCSGFTRWSVSKALGSDKLGASSAANHYKAITHVSGEVWQGDLVFFYGNRDGNFQIVHTGVYIGDGYMIHSRGNVSGIGKQKVNDVYKSYYPKKKPVYGRV